MTIIWALKSFQHLIVEPTQYPSYNLVTWAAYGGDKLRNSNRSTLQPLWYVQGCYSPTLRHSSSLRKNGWEIPIVILSLFLLLPVSLLPRTLMHMETLPWQASWCRTMMGPWDEQILHPSSRASKCKQFVYMYGQLHPQREGGRICPSENNLCLNVILFRNFQFQPK